MKDPINGGKNKVGKIVLWKTLLWTEWKERGEYLKQ